MADNRIADAEQGLYRLPAGASVTVRECEAELGEDRLQSCGVRPTWRVRVQDCDGAEWLICQPHLGEAIMLADENYGVDIVVSRLV